MQKGLRSWERESNSTGREHRVPADTVQDPALPRGQAEARRDRTARTLLPQVEQISGPSPRASRPLQTESSVVTAGADSRALELAAATVVVPTGASQDKKTPISLIVPSLYKQVKHLSLSPEPGRGLSSSPKC